MTVGESDTARFSLALQSSQINTLYPLAIVSHRG